MKVLDIFFDPNPRFRKEEIIELVLKGKAIPGLVLAFLIGIFSYLINTVFPPLNALVTAVILGLIIRFLIRNNENLLKIFLPGILIAPILLIPLGIILYGKNLNFVELTKVQPVILLQLLIMVILAFTLIWVFGKVLNINRKMRLLLGAGSAVCGASAIAISYPIIKATPDDMSKALIANTIIGIIGTIMFLTLFLPYLSDITYATLSGTLLQQTGFVKLAVSSLGDEILTYTLAIKSIRVLLLAFILLALSYIARKKFYVPWYIILFLIVGITFSFVPYITALKPLVTVFYNFFFTSALASIGLNTDIIGVIKGLPKHVTAVTIAFLISVGVFMFLSFALGF